MKRAFARLLWIVVLGISVGIVGCKNDASSGPDVDNSVSRVQAPVFDGITLDDLKAKLGPDYKLEQEGPPTVFVKNSGDHRVALIVMHNGGGKLESLSLHIIGAQGSDAQIDPLCKEAATAVAQALGLATDEYFSEHLNLGVFRNRMGTTYSFPVGTIFFDLIPNNPLVETWRWVSYQPDQVKRDVYVIPKGNATNSSKRPIIGASLEQLTQLLEGFEMVAKIDGEQALFARQLDNHRQAVFCTLDNQGRVTGIEARVADVAEGADVRQCCRELWQLFAKLQYEECDPAQAEAFLTGPMPTYAVSANQVVGKALFVIPIAPDGTRNSMMICPVEPEVENKQQP